MLPPCRHPFFGTTTWPLAILLHNWPGKSQWKLIDLAQLSGSCRLFGPIFGQKVPRGLCHFRWPKHLRRGDLHPGLHGAGAGPGLFNRGTRTSATLPRALGVLDGGCGLGDAVSFNQWSQTYMLRWGRVT